MNESSDRTLVGYVERVTFHNPETGYSVLRVVVEGQPELVTVVGNVSNIRPGETIEGFGRWVMNRQFGKQFKLESATTRPPTSPQAIEQFLASGMIKGLGPSFARKIVQVFGANTAKILDETPVMLRDVPGIGAKRMQWIKESWREHQQVRELMVFLHGLGVSSSKAVRIHRTYGNDAISLIRENPFRLADDIHGIGFKTADELARRLGFPKESPHRVRSALSYILVQATHQGHVALPEQELFSQTQSLVGVEPDVIRVVLDAELEQQRLVRESREGDPWIFLSPLYRAEVSLARSIARIAQARHRAFSDSQDWMRTLAYVQKVHGIALADRQREAIAQVSAHAFSVVTGGPGVGKTTMVRCLLALFTARGLSVALAAPTGRAAKRLSESSGQPAQTIHRLLEFDPSIGGFRRNADDRLQGDLFVVDESSMLDVLLASQLLQAIPTGATVVFVGDADQLPSVGPGAVLGDLIASQTVPVTRLTQVFRQGEGSQIISAAHAIREARVPEPPTSKELTDFYFVEAEEPEEILKLVVTMVSDRIPKRFGFDPLRDIQVLAPMNRGLLGSQSINQSLQATLNSAQGKPEVERFGTVFRVGDRIMQTTNNYQRGVFNGDLGTIVRINREDQELYVSIDGREVAYDFGDLDELTLAYCVTIHKSQGSEYPCVVMPIHTQHFMLLHRNLVYTGVTRGKKLVVIVGSKRAFRLAIHRQESRQRYTALCQRLRQCFESKITNHVSDS